MVDPGLIQSESEVQILSAIRERLGAAAPLDQIVGEVLRLGTKAIGADGSALVLSARDGVCRKFSFIEANGSQRLEEIRVDAGEGIVGDAIAQGRPLVVADVVREPRFSARVDAVGGLMRGSIACMPLKSGGKILGALEIAKKKPGAISDAEMSALAAVSSPMAVMIDYASALSEIKSLHERLEEANQVKAHFLATTSHELRTPINIIIGNLDLLLGGFLGELTPRQKQSLRTALRNSGEALNLISSLLDLSRIEAGQFVIRVEEFRLDEVWKELELLFRIGLAGKAVELVWDAEETLPPLKTDKMKVKEILSNIIFNAVKYTHEGRIRVTAASLGAGETVRITVSDTGVGIPKEYLSVIFEPFRQVEGAAAVSHGGVGLGLNIARRLVELLHGKIDVESEVGRGSTFRVELPARYSA